MPGRLASCACVRPPVCIRLVQTSPAVAMLLAAHPFCTGQQQLRFSHVRWLSGGTRTLEMLLLVVVVQLLLLLVLVLVLLLLPLVVTLSTQLQG